LALNIPCNLSVKYRVDISETVWNQAGAAQASVSGAGSVRLAKRRLEYAMKRLLVIALSLSVTGLIAMAAEGEKKERPAANARAEMLKKYDKNSNGKIDEEEREAMRKDREAEAIKKFDKNGDGKLDNSEREAARAERRKATEAKKPEQPKKDK
jgi:hypothetical protein